MKALIYLTKVSLKILSTTVYLFAISLTLILSPLPSTPKFIKTRTPNIVRKTAAGFFGMKRKAFLLLREGQIKHSGCPTSLKNNTAI
jgi:hypothetical protein